MIKTIANSNILKSVSGGFDCQCDSTDVKFAFDYDPYKFTVSTKKQCIERCCDEDGKLPAEVVHWYTFDGGKKVNCFSPSENTMMDKLMAYIASHEVGTSF